LESGRAKHHGRVSRYLPRLVTGRLGTRVPGRVPVHPHLSQSGWRMTKGNSPLPVKLVEHLPVPQFERILLDLLLDLLELSE